MKIINGKKLYDSKEVCALLGITGITLTSYRKRGLIKAVQIGRGKYSSEDDIQKFLDGVTGTKSKGK